MTLEIIEGNLLDIEEGIICHQVNCQGVMGSGVALQIEKRWRKVWAEYSNRVREARDPLLWVPRPEQPMKGWPEPASKFLLGKCDLVEVAENLRVANIYGQDAYGADGRLYTDYAAVTEAFAWLQGELGEYDLLYVPHNMGCDRGGGDWEIYSEIIEQFFPKAKAVKLVRD